MNLLRDAIEQLSGIEAGDARLEAETLLMHALGVDRTAWRRQGASAELSGDARARFEAMLARRLAREPLDYIVGTKPFCEIEVEVGPGALIPRNDTESLVEQVTAWASRRERSDRTDRIDHIDLIDVGTGSGAIVCALLERFPHWRAIGIDWSPQALLWAERTGRRNGVASRIAWMCGDLLAGVQEEMATIVVANLPYVCDGERESLDPEVRDHEPPEALFGGADGLALVRRLVPQAATVVAPTGLLALELSSEQVPVVTDWLTRDVRFEGVRAYRDLAGRPRGVLAERAR